ncbi:MAG: hypothetical protein WD871_12285 [Xanthobacteraceae bacterium]
MSSEGKALPPSLPVLVGRRAISIRTALPWIFAAGVYLLLLPLGDRLLNDPDSYWHLAVARWIIDHRAFPTVDPFSHTMAGAHWIAFEWLSEMIYAGAYAAAGWPGVVVLAAAAIALAFGLLLRFLVQRLDLLPALILGLVALVLAAPHMLARPHVLVLPLMLAWIAALVRAVDRGAAPPFAFLPLIALWANLHGSVGIGVALILPAAIEAVWQTSRPEWRRAARQWVLFAALAVIAASLTPYGPGILLAPLNTLALGDALSIIGEWQPQDFGRLGAFEMVLLLGIGLALFHGVTLPPVRILVLLGLLHLALSQSRHADLLALLAPLYLAQPLARQLNRTRDAETTSLGSPRLALGGLAVAIMIATGFALTRDIVPAARNTPAAAVAAADLARSGPVLNDYAFGGYLIHAGIAPFIDGRGELYGRTLMLRHHRAVTLQDLPDFLRLLDGYRIGATLLAPKTPAVALLDRLPGWQRVYADEIAVVHKRRDAAQAR